MLEFCYYWSPLLIVNLGNWNLRFSELRKEENQYTTVSLNRSFTIGLVTNRSLNQHEILSTTQVPNREIFLGIWHHVSFIFDSDSNQTAHAPPNYESFKYNFICVTSLKSRAQSWTPSLSYICLGVIQWFR